jgi:hypothetical protein
MPIQIAFIFNLIWAIFIALTAKLFHSDYISVFAILYFAIAYAALNSKKWAILICIAFSSIQLIYWSPTIFINLWLFATQAPLYQESPATILIVFFEILLFFIPAAILTGTYCYHGKELLQSFSRKK